MNIFNESDEIDIILLLLLLIKKRYFILKISSVFFLVGLIYSFSLDNKFKSYTTFYPHYDNLQNENSGIQGLAGLAGINLNSENSINIPPSLYPELIKSKNFKTEILNTEIINNNDKLSYREYLLKVYNSKSDPYKIILYPFNLLKNIFSNQNNKLNNKPTKLNYITKDDNLLFKILNENIFININEKEGFLELYVIDTDPEVSALIAIKANEILQKSIINFKLKNIRDVYDFTVAQLEISKKNLYKIQDSLATFKDSNKSIKSDIFKNKLSRLETEYNISKNIYNELAITKEQTAIDVRKKTPIFTIINPVYVPINKHSPNRLIVILIFTVLGIISSSIWIMLKKPFQLIIKNIKIKLS